MNHKLFPVLLVIVCSFLQASLQDTLNITGVIYDHDPDHNPDFEYIINVDYGIVENYLSQDRRPIFKVPSTSRTVHNSSTFDQWFRSVPGVNIPFPNITITLSNQGQTDPRIYSYRNDTFFPIDNMGFGNFKDYGHNFHFCLEIHNRFLYQGGEVFNFRGDDDVWVFINNSLVIDLGGVSSARTAELNVDSIGLTKGQYYPFDFFFCERHTVASEIELQISLELFCGYYDWCGQCEGDGQSCCVCDDGDPCTISQCDAKTGACTHTPKCEDYNPCTDNMCSQGTCSFPAKTCSDGNACTIDSCVIVNSTSSRCVNAAKVCADSDPCTIDTCDAATGNCKFTTNTCDDGNLCTIDSCNAATGACSNTPKVCDDSNKCTTDSCNSANGQCVFNSITCSDGNLCTVDTCNAATGCVFTPKVCDDSSKCTTDTCNQANGQCVFTSITCSDGNLCTTDSCNAATGCVFTPVVCNDNSVCTTDSCNSANGQCEYVQPANLCNDNLLCTTDSCNAAAGCIHINKVCDDANTCTADSCDATNGQCKYQQPAGQCDDSNLCTQDSCVNGAGCKNVLQSCTDGQSCTTDSCNTATGSCVFTPIPDCGPCTFVTCPSSGDLCNPNVCDSATGNCSIVPVVCNDNDPCTTDTCSVINNAATCVYTPVQCPTTDACNPASCSNGKCITTPRVCNDGDSCTNDTCIATDANNWKCQFTPVVCPSADSCHPSFCVNGACLVSPVVCDDGNSCTNDTCVPVDSQNWKCQYTQVGCTPPDPCHTSTCVNGTCLVTPRVCNDGNSCTNDTCVVVNGNWECQFTDVVCPPVDGCNPTVCSAGKCVVTPRVCDDGNSCTNDTCVSLNSTAWECHHNNVECTYADGCYPSVCSEGTCVPIVYSCDDGDPCTFETCVNNNGIASCVYTNNTCDDGNACTNDVCVPYQGCHSSPVVCPDTACGIGVCDESAGCGLLPRDCSNLTISFCVETACDNNYGCITFPKVCQVKDPECYTATCSESKQECVEDRRDTLKCKIDVTEAAVIGTGAIVGIVLAALAGLALAGFLGKKGFDMMTTGKDALGNVQDNPLYEGETMVENPLFEEDL